MNTRTGSEITKQRYWVLGAVMCGSILGPIDGSIVNVILPTIARDFNAPLARVEWVPMVYLLVVASLLLVFGRLGDMVGYRRIFCSGLAGFAVASGLCALSPGIHWLIAFRGVQGLAAAMMMSMPFALITSAFPPWERGKALGIYAISISLGLAGGPSLGGFLTAWFGWRSAFLVNVPIGLAAWLWSLRILPSGTKGRGRLDIAGGVSLFAAMSSSLVAVNRVQTGRWDVMETILTGIALTAWVVFFSVELRSSEPILDVSVFKNRTFTLASAASLFNFIAQFVMVFLVPFYLARLLHEPADRVGLIMTAIPLAVLAVAPFSGALSDHVGTRLPAVAGALVLTISLGLMATIPSGASVFQAVWRLALFGVGAGIFQSPNNSAIMGSTEGRRLGVASSLVATVRNVGMVAGIALGGILLYAVTPARVLALTFLSGETARAFLHGLRWAFAGGSAAALMAALASMARPGSRRIRHV
ncbi:MAG: MFS transporter [Acidobacteriota bacterium]|jgi:EmrB/QacA subfamily drug resistance transporter